MTWWETTRSGRSNLFHEEGTGLVWGDGPADVVAAALDDIDKEFRERWGRAPLLAEIRAGLEFSLLRLNDSATFVKGSDSFLL